METIIEKQKQKLTKVEDDIFIYIDKDIYIKFINVFEFPESNGKYIGHFNIWDDNAPFYILFERNDIRRLQIKGYKNCVFIPNSFLIGFDRNNKMYLRCNAIKGSIMIKYYRILSINDIRKLVTLRQKGCNIYAGFPYTKGISKIGEAIQLI